MTSELSIFASRLRELISNRQSAIGNRQFSVLAIELFAMQFAQNAAYQKICKARNASPTTVEHWTQIPAVPTSAFKELELSCLPPAERTTVFHSSGTTEQKPSRHYHNAESLTVYEASLWSWFDAHCIRRADGSSASSRESRSRAACAPIILTPSPAQAPHSSLVHMFDVIRRNLGGASVPASRPEFLGQVAPDGAWILDFDAVLAAFNSTLNTQHPTLLLGTAFSFVHLLDFLAGKNLRFELPPGSRVMETGGYKNRSRSMPKAELHALITERLGVPESHIICEYGMSELSSQAYDNVTRDKWRVTSDAASRHPSPVTRHFHFPPWARVQIISPETGREVRDGETGLIRVFDLANVFSVMAIQTEDLAVKRGDGFELIGRAQLAEPRGCSLMTA